MFGTLINEGSQHDKSSIPLSTKRGRWINNVRKPERPPQAMYEAEKFAKRNCPGIQIRSLSSSYNCVGMVFASRRVAVDPDQLRMIFSDDEYRRVVNKADVRPGDLVIYKTNEEATEINHIGVVMSLLLRPVTAEVELLVLSQWGFDGEYIHNEENVHPAYGKYREYYSERK